MSAPDPYVWPRESVADKPNQAWCSACHHRFASTTAFDLHRGIQVRPRREDAQDKGTCVPPLLRLAVGLLEIEGVWYTLADQAQKDRMDRMREARGGHQ